jgi:hypothetical protein
LKTKNKGKKKSIGLKTLIEVQLRKPWQLNWEHGEVLAPIIAKQDKYITSLDKVKPCN